MTGNSYRFNIGKAGAWYATCGSARNTIKSEREKLQDNYSDLNGVAVIDPGTRGLLSYFEYNAVYKDNFGN